MEKNNKKIILDTNFLMVPVQFKVDIFSEIERICSFNYELCVLDKTIEELNNIISREGTKKKTYAKVALNIIKIKKIKVLDTSSITGSEHTDDIIVEIAKNKAYIVATQDKILKKRLKVKSIHLITLRQKKYLVFEKFK